MCQAMMSATDNVMPVSIACADAGVTTGEWADTLREVTIGRGHDPRDFVLLAYGGAGPLR